MDIHTIFIRRIGNQSFLKIGNNRVEIQDYRISSSMREGTELEITFKVKSCEVTKLERGATRGAFRIQNSSLKGIEQVADGVYATY